MRASRSFRDWFARTASVLLIATTGACAAGKHACDGWDRGTLAERLGHLLRHDQGTELEQIRAEAQGLVPLAKAALEERKARRREQAGELPDLPSNELRRHFQDDPALLTSREIRALEEIIRHTAGTRATRPREVFLKQSSDASPSGPRSLADRFGALGETHPAPSSSQIVSELLAALHNNRRSPVPERVGVLTPWRLWLQNFDRTIGRGSRPASNLVPGSSADLSLRDPLSRGFWTRPTSITQQNLAAGFGRDAMPDFASEIWDYAGPKTSSGTHPGIEVRSGKLRLKVKFGEVHSEPFTARIFHALGYNVDPTDCAPELKVRYSRRFFREFNLRRPLMMRFRPFWIPVASIDLQPHYDPFRFVKAAVFKDGRRMTGHELKAALFVDASRAMPENDPANFHADLEEKLSHLELGPVNVQPEDGIGETVGAWDFGGLGHEDLRELRGAGLLAAWLGWFDARFDNTRLRVMHKGDSSELRFFFTDLGAGMGSGRGYLLRNGEQLSEMEETFTSAPIVRGPGRMTTPFKVLDYETIVPAPAFREMTVDDARWMARLIAQLTAEQLRSALLASGYSDEDAASYTRKLIHRRDRMLSDLGLAKQQP